MMGSKFTPTTITPSFSSATAMNMGLGNFANQQAQIQNQKAQETAMTNYKAAVAQESQLRLKKHIIYLKM